MRRLLLILFVTIGLTGCKKDIAKVIKINENLIGSWVIKSNNMIYFDRTGQKEYEEVLTGNQVASVNFFKRLKGKILTPDAQSLNIDYQLVEKDKVVYIQLNKTSIFDVRRWEICEVSLDEMIWQADFSNIKYEDKETGEIIEAPAAELTLKFSKHDR